MADQKKDKQEKKPLGGANKSTYLSPDKNKGFLSQLDEIGNIHNLTAEEKRKQEEAKKKKKKQG